jgi:hypothetical protein
MQLRVLQKDLENEDALKPPLFSSLKHYTGNQKKGGAAFPSLQTYLSKSPSTSQVLNS